MKAIKYLILAMIATVSTAATTYDFISVDNYHLKTTYGFSGDSLTEWSGDGYHAGLFNWGFTMNASQVPTDYVVPDEAMYRFILTDMYGNSPIVEEQDLKTEFKKIKYHKSYTQAMEGVFTLTRGGRYAVDLSISPIDYSHRDTIDIVDEPSLRAKDLEIKKGEDLMGTVYFNTGYPFNMDELTGKEYGTYKIYKVMEDSSLVYMECRDSVQLNLKNEDQPLVAGMDSMLVLMFTPEVGKYKVVLKSDWAPGNGEYDITVADELSAYAYLDKEKYTIGEDNKAKLSINMEYGFPYIQPTEEYPTPSVIISTNLLGKVDTLVIADDSLASKKLDCTASMDIDLSGITVEYLSENNSVDMEVNVVFNGTCQYTATLPIVFTDSPSGIDKISDDRQPKAIYSIDGVKQNGKLSQLPSGIYIVDGKKILK